MINYFKNKSDNFYLFHKYPVAKQFVKFCLVGFTNMSIDVLVYLVLTRGFEVDYIRAAMASFVVAVTWSFFMNRRWTFRHGGTDTANQYVKFFVINIGIMVLNLSSLYILVDWFGFYDLVAKISVAVILALLNFSLNKIWTFKGSI